MPRETAARPKRGLPADVRLFPGLKKAIDRGVEEAVLAYFLNLFKGNRSQTAEFLGLDPANLRRARRKSQRAA